MSVFLIDYENVNSPGMAGIDALTEADTIILFYTKNSDNLSFSLHESLITTQARVELFRVNAGTPNCLDFQLVSYLGYLIAGDEKAEYIIVSKDKGFGGVAAFWSARGVHIEQVKNLLRESEESMASRLTSVLPSFKDDVPTVLQLIEKYKTKQGLNNALVKLYGSEKAGSIYKAIKPFISDKKSQ